MMSFVPLKRYGKKVEYNGVVQWIAQHHAMVGNPENSQLNATNETSLGTPDDTFNALRRQPFRYVEQAIHDMAAVTDINAYLIFRNQILEDAGWTHDEFEEEAIRIYGIF